MTPATNLLTDIIRKADLTRWREHQWTTETMRLWAAWVMKGT